MDARLNQIHAASRASGSRVGFISPAHPKFAARTHLGIDARERLNKSSIQADGECPRRIKAFLGNFILRVMNFIFDFADALLVQILFDQGHQLVSKGAPSAFSTTAFLRPWTGVKRRTGGGNRAVGGVTGRS
jgi:hypothetical protein